MSTRPTRPTPARGLTFNPGNHTYRLDGRPVPGVTTILGCLDKPAIPRWAAGQVAEHVADHPDAVEHLRGLGRGPLVAALKAIPWQKRDTAGARGTTLHDHAERILRGEPFELPTDDPLLPVVEAAAEFMDDWHIRPVLIEAPVASRTHSYAGTLDLIAHYVRPDTGHEGVGIFDWKSGKAIYPEYALQLAAYSGAEFHGLHGDEHPVPQVDAAFGVQIRADGYDVHELRSGPDVFAAFLAVRRTFDVVKAVRGDWKRPGSGWVGVALPAPRREEVPW